MVRMDQQSSILSSKGTYLKPMYISDLFLQFLRNQSMLLEGGQP